MRQFKNFITLIIISIFLLISFPSFADSQKIREARIFIDKFQNLSHNYDERLTDMYSDKAKIIRILEYDDGKIQKVVLPTEKYKNFLKYVKFLAQVKGYKNYYKNLEYETEGEKVRIKGERKNSDGYTGPVSILVGKNENGEWKIFEEATSTKSIFLVKKIFTKN